jgi:hypothetical protein
MATDLSLITNVAEGDSLERSSERDRLTVTSFQLPVVRRTCVHVDIIAQ